MIIFLHRSINRLALKSFSNHNDSLVIGIFTIHSPFPLAIPSLTSLFSLLHIFIILLFCAYVSHYRFDKV